MFGAAILPLPDIHGADPGSNKSGFQARDDLSRLSDADVIILCVRSELDKIDRRIGDL